MLRRLTAPHGSGVEEGTQASDTAATTRQHDVIETMDELRATSRRMEWMGEALRGG